MAGVSVNLDNMLLAGALDRIKNVVYDLQELMTLLCGRAIKMIDRKFQRSGPGWVPLAERTLERRRLRGKGAKPLLDTSQLRKSLVSEGAGSIHEITGDGFRVGTNLAKAATHQLGSNNGWGKGIRIPARPYMPTEAEVEAELLPLCERYFRDKLE